MPIYVYETIPSNPEEKPTIYELQQSMTDAPLTRHPETGEPIRRVILGGFGILSSAGNDIRRSGCGPGAGCCG
ncbi:MAG TPA: zinc ribbon domain-containing protein [bacterium]|nr:zinc ribbon domain-containing protein [Candidatus Omnitrophota bacterium]HOL94609.1 zinc ribbon domain-containing protein [bacterium]HPP01369.1 zinc ribbon domain-containing protein [bacterium]